MAERLLYRRVTVTTAKQLYLLSRTLDTNKYLHSMIHEISIPRPLHIDPPRTHNSAGMRLSDEQLVREKNRVQIQVSSTIIHVLSLVT